MRRLFFAVLMLCLVWNTRTYAQTPPATQYRYGYLTHTDAGETNLNLIDPNDSSMAVATVSLPVPKEDKLDETTTSPDGKWLLLYLETADAQAIIRVIEVATGAVHDLGKSAASAGADPVIIARRGPKWSPDSKALAYVLTGSDSNELDVYTLDSAKTVKLNTGTDKLRELVWSNDSTMIAVASTQTLSLYNAQTGASFATLSTSLTFKYQPCGIAVSPTNAYVAFIVSCDDKASLLYDVYIWDIAALTAKQLTHFTNPNGNSPNGPQFFTDYDLTWYDDHTLLTGIQSARKIYKASQAEIIPGTLIARTSTLKYPGALEAILTKQKGSEWTWFGHQLAFRADDLVPNPDTVLSVQTATVEIAAFDGKTLTSSFQGPPGCRLSWSPDGATLGYIEITGNTEIDFIDCGNPRNIVFARQADGSMVKYPFAKVNRPSGIVGWLTLGADGLMPIPQAP